jgi:hypothetical protein
MAGGGPGPGKKWGRLRGSSRLNLHAWLSQGSGRWGGSAAPGDRGRYGWPSGDEAAGPGQQTTVPALPGPRGGTRVFKRPREASEGARRVSRHGKARAHAREEREATLIAKEGWEDVHAFTAKGVRCGGGPEGVVRRDAARRSVTGELTWRGRRDT